MGSNSMRDNITKDDIISEIRLELSADIKKNKVITVVEGQDDIKLLKKLLDANVCMEESYSGKAGLHEIINFFKEDSRVIGIRDRDYDYFENINKIFAYDHSCLEMMILSDTDSFNSVYSECYGKKNYTNDKLLNLVLNSIMHISILRKINSEDNHSINFRGIKMRNIIDNESRNIEKLTQQIKKNNPKIEERFIGKLKERLIQKCASKGNNDELLDITQGHDFIEAFHLFCEQDEGRTISQDSIAACMRCSFNPENFKKTDLYNKLKKYEKDNQLVIVK